MADAPPRESLVDRTFRRLRRAWRDIAAREGDDQPTRGDPKKLRARMTACLTARGGEVSARARTAALGREYLTLDADGRHAFLAILASEFDVDRAAVRAAAAQALEAGDNDTRAQRAAREALRKALEAPRLALLTRFNALPEGVKFLVDMRAEVMALLPADASLAPLLDDLTQLLASWFDVGFLELRRITWDAPASLLEKLIAYEAVHEIGSWDDLKNRLDSDRRCFAFFHPRMADEPLIFVEVALTDGMADSIQALLDPEAPVLNPREADTAIFFSISNAQRGLAGISFGGFLIKQVADVLAGEFRGLKTFATLSPIPGFMSWLRAEDRGTLLKAAERKALAGHGGGLLDALGAPDWRENKELVAALEAPLTRLCARYLLTEKRADGFARDPVAHFHLTNGARVERLNWLGDVSPKGMAASAGLMVNYRYDMDEIERNHEAYRGDKAITASASVRALARG